MVGDLFSKPPQYTIDSSSLIDIYADEKMVSKNITPGLWANVDMTAYGNGTSARIKIFVFSPTYSGLTLNPPTRAPNITKLKV